MKVLVIYYKQDAVVSTLRLGGLIKYLPEFGWEPIILTNKPSPELNKFKVITVPYDDDYIKRLPKPLRNIKNNSNILLKIIKFTWMAFFLYPDAQKYWYEPAFDAVEDLLENEDIDAVISSFPPVTPHLIAKSIHEKYGIPWIADLRDLWTQYGYYVYRFMLPRYYLEKRLELETLSQADYLTIVSKPLGKKLKLLHKNSKICVIPNGFDPEQINPGYSLSKKFSMTYSGGLWNGRRDPRMLFEAIDQLKKENKINIDDFEINFFGPNEDVEWLREIIKSYEICEIIKIHGLIPRDKVINKQWESQLLLLFLWDNPDEKGVFTGKIFEYLAAKRPILAVGYVGGVVDELLDKTNVGISLNKVDRIKEEILKAYSQFKSSGSVSYNGKLDEVKKYSHKEMAKKFVDILKILNQK
jgi:glycosyltransferase involved in cell wall biosynthesis